MQRTSRRQVGNRFFMVREEFNPATNEWEQISSTYDANQSNDPNSGQRTGSYYSSFTQNLHDFQEAKRQGSVRVEPPSVNRGQPVVGRTYMRGAPNVTDDEGNPLTTGIPMNLRKHVNKVVRQSIPAPGQPARADYEAARDQFNQIQNGPGRLVSSSVTQDRSVAQQQAWNTLVSRAEAVILRQAIQIKGQINTQYQQEARKIASSSSSDKKVLMADLDARNRLALSELDKLVRTGQSRKQLANNLARTPIGQDMVKTASQMIQNSIASALTPMGDYTTQRPSSSMMAEEIAPRVITQSLIDPKRKNLPTMALSRGGSVKILKDNKGNPITRQITITPQTRLSAPAGYNVKGSTPAAQGPAPYANPTIFSSSPNDPMQALEQTRKAWQKLLSSGNASAADRDIGQKAINALNVLEDDWKGKNNAGVAAQNLPRIKPAYRIDAVQIANKEYQWMLDAEQMATGRTIWQQGSYSNDPKIKESMAKTGTGISGAIANPQAVADRQKSIMGWLHKTSKITDPQTGGVTWLKNRNLFAGQDNARKQGGKSYTGAIYNGEREHLVRDFLVNDPQGKSIAAQFKSVEEAIPHVLHVINYAAKMQAFQAPMEARDIKGSGAKKQGLDAGLTETPQGQIFHTGNIESLRIADLFNDEDLAKKEYEKYSAAAGELKRLGVTRQTPVGEVLGKMMMEIRGKYQGSITPDKGMEQHFPILVGALNRYISPGGSGSGALSSRDIQQEFGTDHYEGHQVNDLGYSTGDDDADLMDEIGSSRFGGVSGLNPGEAEFSGKSRWSFDILRHRKNTIVFDRLNRAKIADMYRVMSAVTGQGSAEGPSEVAQSQAQKYENAARRSEFSVLTGLDPAKSVFRDDKPMAIAQILGTTAGGYDLEGSRKGPWGESIFYGEGRGRLGKETHPILRKGVWRDVVTNPLEDEARHFNTEEAHLNREHALLLARIGTPQRQYETTPPTWDEATKQWNIPQTTIDPQWRGRDIPSDTHGSLQPIVRGAGTVMKAYNSLVLNTKEMYGLHEDGNPLSYGKAMEQAQRAGDFRAMKILQGLQEESKEISTDIDGMPMGRGLAQSSKLPDSHYLPFNPLFAAMMPDIEQGSWNMTRAQRTRSRTKVRAASQNPRYADLFKRSSGVTFTKDVLHSIFGQPATDLAMNTQMDPDEFRELFAQRAGLRKDGYGRLVNSRDEVLGNMDGDSFSYNQTVSMLHRGFGPELEDWAKNAFAPQSKSGIKRDPTLLPKNFFGHDKDGNRLDPALVMAHSLVSSGALNRALGGPIGVEMFNDVQTRGPGYAPFKETSESDFHRSDRIVQKMDVLAGDLFKFGGSDAGRSLLPTWGGLPEEYGNTILKIRSKLGLWDEKREFNLITDSTYNNKRKAEEIQLGLRNVTHTAMSLRNWVSDMNSSEVRRTSDAFELPPGLLDDMGMSDEDRYQALIMSREERTDAFAHKSLEAAEPELNYMLSGINHNQRLETEMSARGTHGPPGYLEYGTILNAMFDAIASQAEVKRSVSDPDSKYIRMHEIDESMHAFRDRSKQEISSLLDGGRATGITMTRAMLAGESQSTAARFGAKGVGLHAIETTSQASKLTDLLKRAKSEYDSSQGGPLGFSSGLLRDFASLFNLDYDVNTFSPVTDEEGQPRGYKSNFKNMPNQLIKGDKVYIKNRIGYDRSNMLSTPYGTHLPIGATTDIDAPIENIKRQMGPDDIAAWTHVRAYTPAEHATRHHTILDPNNPESAISQLMDATGSDENDRAISLADQRLEMEGFKELHNLQPSPSRFKNLGAKLRQRRNLLANLGTGVGGNGSGFDIDDLRKQFQDELARIGVNIDVHMQSPYGQMLGAYVPADASEPSSINMYVDPKKFNSVDEAFQASLSTLHHEAFHYLSDSGYISQDQVKAIAALSPHLPSLGDSHPGESLFSQVESQYRPFYEKNNPAMIDRLHEEHAARVYQSYVSNNGELPGIHPDELIPLDDIFSGAGTMRSGIVSRGMSNGRETELVVQNGKLIRRNPRKKTPSSSHLGMRSGSRGGMPPLPPAPFENISDKYDFHPDPEETIAPIDKMMQQLAQFATKNARPLFDVREGGYKGIDASSYDYVHPSFMQSGGREWTKSQREFIGAPVIEGAGPLVLTGNPGAGKTAAEVARIIHRMKQPGMTPESAPILTSFAHVTLDETVGRLNKLLEHGQLDKETVQRYLDSGGVTTIHGLGMRLLSDEHLGWGNVFGSASRITNLDGKDVYGKAGRDIRVKNADGTLMTHEQISNLKGMHARMEKVNGKWQIRKGQDFDRYQQASKEHQIEMFRESLHEIWRTDLAQSNYDASQTEIMRHAAGSMPFIHTAGGPTVRRGVRDEIYDRDRPFIALQSEMKATGEDLLWKNVQTIAETGVSPQMAMEFFNPVSANPRVPDELAGYNNEFTHNKGEMWLAAKVYAMMDERAQRGSIQGRTNDKGVVQAELVRNYMPWDLVNKPLQYMQSHTTTDTATGKEVLHPGIANALHGILGREFIVSEGQDANLGQLALIKALAQGWHKVALSGDPKQDLYGWRGGTRRWLKLAAEAAKKSGSYINLAETFRFTGGTTDLINQFLEKTTFTGKNGDKKRLIPEAPLKAMGDLSHQWQASAVAVNVHPYGPEGEFGGRDWEHEVMAQQVRHMMGMGVAEEGMGLDNDEAFSLNPHQRSAIHKAVYATGAEAGGARPEDFLVTAISNEEVAEIVKKYRSRGVNAMAKFSNDKLDEWQGLSDLFKAFPTKDLQQIKENRDFKWFASDDEGQKILSSMRGGDEGVGRYRMTGNSHEGVENLIDDVLKARDFLSLPHNLSRKPDPETGDSEQNYVVVGTIPGLKGRERKFVQIPGVTEKNFKMKMASSAVEARENFSKILTALTRGSQAFMYGSNVTNNNERRKGKNVEHAWFRAAKEFQASNTWGEGEIQPIHIGEDYRPMPARMVPYAVQRTLAPGEFISDAPVKKSRYADYLEKNASGYRAFAQGGIAHSGHVIVGEGNQEEMVITKDGAHTVRGTHILDVGKMGGFVEVLNQEQIKAARAKGQKLANEIVNGIGEPTARRGGLFKSVMLNKIPKPQGSQAMAVPDLGMGTMSHFGENAYGEQTATELLDFLRHGLKLDAEMVSDPGKGHVVKTNAKSAGEVEHAKIGLAAWANQRNAFNSMLRDDNDPDSYMRNADLMATGGALDPTHKAYAGTNTADLGVGGTSKAYAKDSEMLNKLTKPVDDLIKKTQILTASFGKGSEAITTMVNDIRKSTNSGWTGNIVGAIKDFHAPHGTAQGPTGAPLQSSEAYLKQLGIKGPMVEPRYNEQGELLVHRPSLNKMTALGPTEQAPPGYRRRLTGQDLVNHQVQNGYPVGPQIPMSSQVGKFVMAGVYNSWIGGMAVQATKNAEQGFEGEMAAASQQHAALNYAVSQGNMAPPATVGVGSFQVANPNFQSEASGARGFILNQYKSNQRDWEKKGISAADYAQNAGVFLSMGGHGFSDQTIAGANAASQDAAATGKDIAQAFTDYLSNSSEGKNLTASLTAANNIAFAGQTIGVSPDVMLRATQQFGNASGVTNQDASYMTSTAGVLMKAAANSTADVNDFITGSKYVLANMAPMLSGVDAKGNNYGTADSMGLSAINADGTKKTAAQLQSEVHGQAKTAEIVADLAAGENKGIGVTQMGRALENVVQTQYSMNNQQSWLYAQQTGVVDKNNKLTGVYTSNPQVYQEAIRQQQADYGVTQMQDQLSMAGLQGQDLNIQAKSIQIQTQSVALESKKFAEMAPIQKQTMIDQNAVQNLGYAQNLRQAQFAVSLQPEEAQVFSMQQQQQKDELARTQRSVAASRAYEDALYGSPGTDRSYNAFSKSQQNALAQGQGSQNIGQYVNAVTQGVGLEAAQTYEGIDYSRTMLTLGQSNLNSGAAYAAQMQHLNMTQGFAEKKFGLDSTQRKTEREIQDESLKQQADLLPVVMDLQKKQFDEQQRQTRESLAMTLAQGKTLNDSNAAFDINLKYYDQETSIQKDQYKNQLDELDLQTRINAQNKIQNDHLKSYLTEIIPKMVNFNQALKDQLNGFGANKGRTDIAGNNPLSGQQDPSQFISTLLKAQPGEDAGAASRRLLAVFGNDMSAAPAGSVLANLYSTMQGGDQREIDKAIKDLTDHPDKFIAQVNALHGGDINENTTPAAQANAANTAADAGVDSGTGNKTWLAKHKASWEHKVTRVTNALGFPAISGLLSPLGGIGSTLIGMGGWKLGGKILSGLFGGEEAAAGGAAAAGGGGGLLAGLGSIGTGIGGFLTGATGLALGATAVGAGAGYGVDKAFGHFGVNTGHAGTIIGTTTGLGAGVGAMFGGVGAAPGALIGAAVGIGIVGIKEIWDHRDQIIDMVKKGFGFIKDTFTTVVGLPWKQIGETALKVTEIALPPLGVMIETFKHLRDVDWGHVKDNITQFIQIAENTWDGIRKAWDDHVQPGINEVITIGEAMIAAWNTITGWFHDQRDHIGERLDTIKDAMVGLFGFIGDIFVKDIEVVQNLWDVAGANIEAFIGWFTDHFDSARKWLDDNADIVGAIGTLVNGVIGWIQGIPGQIIGEANKIMSDPAALAKQIFNGLIIDPVNALLGAISGLKISVPHGDLIGLPSIGMPDLPQIPTLATGGYATGGLTLVGENGPELVQLGKGDTVVNATRSMQVLRGYAPSVDMRTGHARSLAHGDYDPRFTLHPETARNITNGSHNNVSVTINIASGATVDEAMINKLKTEVISGVRKVIEES